MNDRGERELLCKRFSENQEPRTVVLPTVLGSRVVCIADLRAAEVRQYCTQARSAAVYGKTEMQ